MSRKLCLMGCSNLRRELETVLAKEGFEDVLLRTFPANCDTGLTWDTVRRVTQANGAACGQVELIGGGCLLGLSPPPEELAFCRLHSFEQCFHLFLPSTTVDYFVQQGAYLLTPGWLAHWEEHLKTWGFDRETATAYFGEFCTKLLLLDTGVQQDSGQHLHALADYLSLPAEILPVGLDFLRQFIKTRVEAWRSQIEGQARLHALNQANQQTTDYAMAFDLMGDLAQLITEEEVINWMFDVFAMLFAPLRLVFTVVVNHQAGQVWTRLTDTNQDGVEEETLSQLDNDYAWTENGHGFYVKINHGEKTEGLLKVEELALPEHKQQYLNLALAMAKVCGLAIANARVLKGIIPICANCKKIRDKQNQWHPVDVYIHRHSEIDFSHGLCPDCARALYPDFFE